MSLHLLKQNINSPFQLQRSIVNQGGEGGAYESGGFTGKSQYNDGGAAAAISSIGDSVAAGMDALTAGDINKMNENKANSLTARKTKTETKKQNAVESKDISKADKMANRSKKIDTKLGETNKKIKEYKESKNLTLKSDIKLASIKEPAIKK